MVEASNGPDAALHAEILATCACLQLRKAARRVTQLYDRALRPVGLRATQLPVLMTLSARPVLPITVLAQSLVLDRTTLSRNLTPLVRRGLVEVDSDGGRTHEVKLTAKGHAVMARAIPLWARAQAQVMEHLQPRESADLQRALTRLASLPDQAWDRASRESSWL